MICAHGVSRECEQLNLNELYRKESSCHYGLLYTISHGIRKSHRSPHSLMKSPADTGYRIGSYRAHDEYDSLYSIHSPEEYRDMKWSFFRECGRYERGGGDDGDGSRVEYGSYCTDLFNMTNI